MTVYLYMHPLDQSGERATLVRLNALRALRDELSVFPGVSVSATPVGADLEVEIVNVVATDDVGGMLTREAAPRILVVRMARNNERIDFVCSDGHHGQTAERQAARRIRNWVAGEDFLSLVRPVASDMALRPVA